MRALAAIAALVAGGCSGDPVIPYVPFSGAAPIQFSDGCPERAGFASFVTRDGDRLMDGARELRFIGFNAPNLHILEDPIWHLPHPWEQGDALCSIVQAGGEVVRIYVLSVGDSHAELPRHVPAPGTFSEELFVALDSLLELANRFGVRVILPFVDRWHWWGGVADYAGFHGLDEDAFYTDGRVRADFARTVDFVVSRVNKKTGIAYRDDPAILGWETGNELGANATDEWTAWLAARIRSLDRNHLIIDGRLGVSPWSLASPDIDVVSNHYYQGDYAESCDRDASRAAGQRPFLVGEAGLAPLGTLKSLLTAAVGNATSGVLLWSLRYHDAGGGFYWHDEHSGYRAYHWPGFDSGDAYDERALLPIVRAQAFAIRGIAAPPIAPPAAPALFPIADAGDIRWRGSAGASSYLLERAPSPEGPWQVVVSGFHDAAAPNRASVADRTPSSHYRITARNEGGSSPPSNVVPRN